MKKILVIHGPNMQLLGQREVSVYGEKTIDDINAALIAEGKAQGVSVLTIQSNHEGEIVTCIGNAKKEGVDGIVINPAAYTHTSVAIHDALKGCGVPSVEVHMSNIFAREDFRHTSLTAPAVKGQICGFGWRSYLLGLRGLIEILS